MTARSKAAAKPAATKPTEAKVGHAPSGQVSAPAPHDSSAPKDIQTKPAPPVTAVNAGDPDHRLETPVPPTADHQATVADDVNIVEQPKDTFARPADTSQVVVKTDPLPPAPNQNSAVNGLADNQPGVTRDAQNAAREAYLKTGTPPVRDPNAGVGSNAKGAKGYTQFPPSSAEDGTPGVEQPVGR